MRKRIDWNKKTKSAAIAQLRRLSEKFSCSLEEDDLGIWIWPPNEDSTEEPRDPFRYDHRAEDLQDAYDRIIRYRNDQFFELLGINEQDAEEICDVAASQDPGIFEDWMENPEDARLGRVWCDWLNDNECEDLAKIIYEALVKKEESCKSDSKKS